MPVTEDLNHATLYEVSRIEEVDLAELRDRLETFSIVRVRGLVPPSLVRLFLDTFYLNFDHKLDKPGCGESRQDIMGNLQKLSIGGGGQLGYIAHGFSARFTLLCGDLTRLNCTGPFVRQQDYETWSTGKIKTSLSTILRTGFGLPPEFTIILAAAGF
jgi:hypothetical protein